ncbi:MAG: hypothetical protein AAGJ35_13780, partial [Myxococcota bacterium]
MPNKRTLYALLLSLSCLLFFVPACETPNNTEQTTTEEQDGSEQTNEQDGSEQATAEEQDGSEQTNEQDGSEQATPKEQADNENSDQSPENTPETASGVTLENLLDKVSTAMCGALLRCCSQENHALYFANMRRDEVLKKFAQEMPPNTQLTSENCPSLLQKIYAVRPMGGWVRAAQRGRVQFHPDAADKCLQELDTAQCGQPMFDALYNPTCFAFSPPLSGSKRTSFSRTEKAGSTCTLISDGFNGAFYGTCDPQDSFCCYEDT